MRRGQVTSTGWARTFSSTPKRRLLGTEKAPVAPVADPPARHSAYLCPFPDRDSPGQRRLVVGRRVERGSVRGRDRRRTTCDRLVPGRYPRVSAPRTGPRRARPGSVRACGVDGAGRIGAADPAPKRYASWNWGCSAPRVWARRYRPQRRSLSSQSSRWAASSREAGEDSASHYWRK